MAPLLAMIVELHGSGVPFPRRISVAEMLHCSVYGVDAALSVMAARELITESVKVAPGRVSARESAIRIRFIRPSWQVLESYRNALGGPGR